MLTLITILLPVLTVAALTAPAHAVADMIARRLGWTK